MSDARYIEHLEARLTEIDQSLAKARARVEAAGAPATESALRELSELEERRASAAERLEAAKARHAEDWSTLHASFREELDGLQETVERWFRKYS
jgi:chromosome segregation ATPase